MKVHVLIKHSSKKGRGVFANKPFKKGELVERCELIILPAKDIRLIDKTFLYNYYFGWGRKQKAAALALGNGSLYNHSYAPNARYVKNFDQKIIRFIAIRDIEKGEEIFVNYTGKSDGKEKVWFEVK